MAAAPRYLFFTWVIFDKVKEWYHLVKGFNWKNGNYNVVFYVLFDFQVYFYMVVPLAIMVPFFLMGLHKTLDTTSFLAATGACFSVCTYASVMSNRISEHYKKKMEAPL